MEIAEIEREEAECQEIVMKLEEELHIVKHQEMSKQQKLNRANCTLKNIMKKIEHKDLSHYEVSKSSFFL